MTGDEIEAERPVSPLKVALKIAMVVAALALGLFVVVPMGFKITYMLRDARRLSDVSNMKQLGIGIHNRADASDDAFIGPYTQVSPGVMNTELSFRVGLLPFMECDTVYGRIDRSQPWDSAKNAPATSTPLKYYQSPDTPDRSKPDTPYRVFYGGGALFEADGAPVKLRDIPDGLSNTILFVHATEAVPWAKPQEFAYTPTTPLPPLGSPGIGRGGFNAAFADVSVRFLRHTIPEADLRSLIEKADGRVVTE